MSRRRMKPPTQCTGRSARSPQSAAAKPPRTARPPTIAPNNSPAGTPKIWPPNSMSTCATGTPSRSGPAGTVTVAPPAELLFDLSGGVVDVDAVRAYLTALTRDAVVHESVYALENDPGGVTVWSPSGKARFDAVVVAAGAGTSPLAAHVGIYTLPSRAHHVRFTFPIDRSAMWPCWINKPATGMSTYQHPSGSGMWSVGGSLDPALPAWEVGREAAAAASEEAVLRYVREQLTVQPRILDRLYRTTTPELGGGFEVRRIGPVLAVYGENLFKLAPVIGEVLAAAALDGSTPSVQKLAAS